MDFHSLTRRELQALCKKNGIPANITNVAMADSLKALLNTVQGVDDLSNCSQSLTAQSGVESPERSEVSSPRVPRTRSIRKKVGNETLVNQTQSRARRTTRNLNSAVDEIEKDTIAPINIDGQFSEVQKQSKKISTSKEAGNQTPSMVSNTRKRVSKGETTAKTYGTRRSTRLAAKIQEDTSDAANMKLFSADGGDNYEMSVKECNPDLSEDVQSTVSHSEVVSETSKCEEMTSNYSGVEIQNDLGSGYDSTMDYEKIVEMVIAEVPEEENEGDDLSEQPEVENMEEVVGVNGDDFHEQPEVENNVKVIGENGDDFYEEPEVEMKDEVNAENGDVVTKQPDTEIMAEVAAVPDTEIMAEVAEESSDLNGEYDVLNDNGEVQVVTAEVMNCLTDNGDIVAETKDHDAENLVPEMKGLTLGDNGDMIVEAEEHVAGDALVVKELMSESEEEEADVVTVAVGEQLVNGDCVALGVKEFVSESEKEEAVVTIAPEEQLDNGDSDALVGEESESEFESEFGSESESEEELESESEEEDIVTEKQLDVVTIAAEEAESESEEEAESESESEEEADSESEEEDIVTKKQLDNGDCDTFVGNEESVPKSDEEKADVVTIVAKEQLVKLDCDNKPSQENSGDEDATGKAQIDSQMICLDDGIFLPAIVPLTGNNKSAANTKMIDNPNVLVGKENSVEYTSVAKEDNNQQNKVIDPTALSMRQLKKELKKLSLNNKKANSVKLDEELGTVPRPALQTLPENHQF